MSEWRISSMYLGGKKVYQVYRIKDMRVVDHSGNRDCCTMRLRPWNLQQS